jgi:hypothetical protein
MSQTSGFVQLRYASHLQVFFVVGLTGNYTAKWHLCAANVWAKYLT